MTDIPLILLQNTHPFHCCLFQNNCREGGEGLTWDSWEMGLVMRRYTDVGYIGSNKLTEATSYSSLLAVIINSDGGD